MRFGYRFCLAMADPYALKRVSAKRLRGWMLYEEVEPFGERYTGEPTGELRADWRAARVCETFYNVMVDPKHRRKTEEFLLKFEKPKKPKTWQEMQKISRMIVDIYNAPGINQ